MLWLKPAYLDHTTQCRRILNKALTDILRRVTSGTAASILNNSEGSGANLLQAVFYPAKSFDSNTEIQWIGEMQKLYRHFGEPFTEEAEAAMTAFMKNNQQGKHGRHTYSVEDYGLTRKQIRAHYKDYCDRFSIPVKA